MDARLDTDCRDCPETIEAARTLGQNVCCPVCGTYYGWDGPTHGDLPPRPLRRRNARGDMITLARWRPLLEGRAVAPSPIVGDGNRGGTSPQALAGRPDAIDAQNPEIRRALAAAARLRTMEDHPPRVVTLIPAGAPAGEGLATALPPESAVVCLALDVQALTGKGAAVTVAVEFQGTDGWTPVASVTARSLGLMRVNVDVPGGGRLRVRHAVTGAPMRGHLRATGRRVFTVRQGLQVVPPDPVVVGELASKGWTLPTTTYMTAARSLRVVPAWRGKGAWFQRLPPVPSARRWRQILQQLARPASVYEVSAALYGPRSRLAGVVWHAYGARGELLDLRESAAADLAARHGTQDEHARFAAQHPDWTPEAVAIGVGNALLGAATAAYEDDVWGPVVPPRAGTAAPSAPSARARFVGRMVERVRGAGSTFARPRR